MMRRVRPVSNVFRCYYQCRLLLVVLLLCTTPAFGRIVDPYKTLGISRNTPQKEMQKRYRELCLRYHPDKNVQKSAKEREKCEGHFKQVQEAYDMIQSPGGSRQQQYARNNASPYGSDPLAEAFARAFEGNGKAFFYKMGTNGPSFGMRTPFPTRGSPSPMMPANLSFKSIYVQKVKVPLEDLYKGIQSFRFELRDNLFTRYRAAIRGKIIYLSFYQGMMYSLPILRMSKLFAAVVGLCIVHATLPQPDPEASYTTILRKGTRGGKTNVKFASTSYGQPEIIFEVEEASHPIYRRKDNDLHAELTITSKEAKNGCRKRLKALDPNDKSIKIIVPPNIYSYKKEQKQQKKQSSSSSSSDNNTPYDNNIRIRGRGWPIRNTQYSENHPDVYLYGDVIVKIKVSKPPSKRRGNKRR